MTIFWLCELNERKKSVAFEQLILINYMRVITGTARGRRLKTVETYDVRPTTDRVKEAIFSIVQFDIEGSVVLDLFSGSGQMGIEALSRGASFSFFIDSAKESCEVIKANIDTVGFQSKSNVANMDSVDFLKNTTNTFDLAILDPPYSKGCIQRVLPQLEKKMSDHAKVICEHEIGLKLPEKVGKLRLKKKYQYGKIEVTLYTAGEEIE